MVILLCIPDCKNSSNKVSLKRHFIFKEIKYRLKTIAYGITLILSAIKFLQLVL